jgi:hypothetical protein
VILRHRFTPVEPGLGRHVAHDDESRDYPAEVAPRLVSVRHPRNIGILNQRALGSCTGNATAGCLSTQPFVNAFDESYAVSLYSAATRLDAIDGHYPPTDTGSSGLAVMKVALLRHLIEGYSHGFGLEHVLHALVLRPGITGITWLSGCDNPDASGIVRYEGSVRGGHEIELQGLDVDARLVWFVNSWGEGWGKDGYFAMTFDDYAKALEDHGDATFPRAP